MYMYIIGKCVFAWCFYRLVRRSVSVEDDPPPPAPPAVAARASRFQRQFIRTLKGSTETDSYTSELHTVWS